MSDFTVIPPSTFDTDQPVLGATHLAMYENLFAAGEGAPNAPKFGSAALNMAWGTGTASNNAEICRIVNVSRIAVFFYTAGLRVSSSSTSTRITSLFFSQSYDGGATWSALETLAAISAAGSSQITSTEYSAASGIKGVPVGVNAVRLVCGINSTTAGSGTVNATLLGIAGR